MDLFGFSHRPSWRKSSRREGAARRQARLSATLVPFWRTTQTVSEVTSADVLEILAPLWHTKAPTARYVHHRVRAVLEWASAMDWRTDNPCDRLLPVLGTQHDVVEHRRALPHREVAAAIETVRESTAPSALKLAFEFLVLTAGG